MRKPKSWWLTPEYIAAKQLQYVMELANWQRAGGKSSGEAPKPPTFPEDRESAVKSVEELAEKRASQREHLQRRRAQTETGRR